MSIIISDDNNVSAENQEFTNLDHKTQVRIDPDSQKTEHTKIMRARERYISKESLESVTKDLLEALNRNDDHEFKTILTRNVEGYKSPKLSKYV